MAFNFAGMFAYIATSPLVFMNNLGMTSAGFAALFALTAMGTIAGSWVNGKLIHAGFAEHRMLGGACASLLAGAFYDGQTSHAMAGVMLACAVLGALTFVVGYRSVMPHPFGEQAG